MGGHTLQDIATKFLPDALAISREEITEADGARFSLNTVVQQIDFVNQDIAKAANKAQFPGLQGEYDFTLTTAQQQSLRVSLDLPVFVSIPISLDAIDDNSETLDYIWYRRGDQGYYGNEAYQNIYEILAGKVVMRRPKYAKYRLRYQKAPGRLCYGTVNAGASTTSIAVTVTAGQLSLVDDSYVGDEFAVIAADGSYESKVVTAYDASAKTFTFTDEFSATPSSGQSWCILGCAPASHADLLVHGAGSKFMDVPERAQVCAAQYSAMMEAFISSITPVEDRTGRNVKMSTPPFCLRGFNRRRPYGQLY